MKKIKKIYILLASLVLLLIIYLLSFILDYQFYSIVKTIAGGATILAIIFSGAFASGDRLRANYSTNENRQKASVLNAWNFLIFAFPFYVAMFIIEVL